jgi:hypothetical protein
MSQYTLELRELVENNVNIFNFDYPIFDEAYRKAFQDKIINHFYFREIGCETTGRFLFNLKTKLNEIMPYYNKRYMAMGLEQRILDNYDVTETYTKDITATGNVNNTASANNTGTQSGSGTSSNKTLFSDTPQGRTSLAGTEYVTEITEDTGATGNTVNTEGNTATQGTTTTADTTKENWTRTMKGNIGVQTDADAVVKYMQSLVNVDLEVFKELNDLFMQVY